MELAILTTIEMHWDHFLLPMRCRSQRTMTRRIKKKKEEEMTEKSCSEKFELRNKFKKHHRIKTLLEKIRLKSHRNQHRNVPIGVRYTCYIATCVAPVSHLGSQSRLDYEAGSHFAP